MTRPLRQSLLPLLLVGLLTAFLPAQESLTLDLAQPADTVHLTDGRTLRIAPLALYPGPAKKLSDPLVCEQLDKPGEPLRLPAANIAAIVFFETDALRKIEPLLSSTEDVACQAADKYLQKLGNLHDSLRSHPPLAANPWASLQAQVADQLHELRKHRLALFDRTRHDDQVWSLALRQADAWLALDPRLRDGVRSLWASYGTATLKDGDLPKALATLDHLDAEFLNTPQAEPLRQALHERAHALAKAAAGLTNDQAIVKLEQALALWPQAPDLRDQLEKLTKSYRVLHVAVRELPDNLSPATAWTNSEKQALDLLFRRLVQVKIDNGAGQFYEPDLITQLPQFDGLSESIDLRRDAFWSSGERVTAADVRHAVQLTSLALAAGDVLNVPRFDGRPFGLELTLKQGLLDPLAPLQFYVLPQKYRKQPLVSALDAEFAKTPLGNGPFRYVGRTRENQRSVAVFRTNSYFSRQGKKGDVREIRFVAWNDFLAGQQPQPHLVLDAAARSADLLKKKGYADVRYLPNRRVYFLAVNHRVAALANQDLRRALSLAIPRDRILQDHFRPSDDAARLFVPLNGPFPAQSWASCPPPRVPEETYQPVLAQAFAKKAGQQLGPIHLTLKYPADAPGVQEACAAIAAQAADVFTQTKANLAIDLVPLSSQQMREALDKRDYELAYHHWDYPDDNYWLGPLFDPQPSALRPGGSNYLGYDNDAELQRLLRSALSHRQFASVREYQQSIHVHLYERVPFIPLWQIPETIALHPGLNASAVDPQHVFANVLDWTVP